jgi:type II secretory pathway pseudopilin PulG
MSSTSNRSGFVLLEAVVALAIISLFAIGLLSMVGAQVRASDRANVLLIERALGEDRLMSARMLDNEDLNELPDSLAAGTFPEPFSDFSWAMSITPVEDEHDLFTVDVLISGRGYTLPLKTLAHEPSPVVQTQPQ